MVLLFSKSINFESSKSSKLTQKRTQPPPLKSAKKKAVAKPAVPTDQEANKNWKSFNSVLSQHKITYKLRRARG